ncbi:TPA: glucosyltransferase domain-containing protein [Aeromonas salmonicida]|nr:glucosyltransferase domain-containing protein [Aeromonas salmonicida]
MKVKNWYLWIIFSSVIYVLPLIIANVSYIDDMGRSIDGYGWIRDGRLLADYVVKGITFGNGIVTVFPFSLILSAVIYAVSGVVISSVLFEIDSKLKRLSSFVFISSPFLLENMAYKFDALPMSLSVFFAVLPFLIKDSIRFFVTSVICLVITLHLYQASAMLYFGMALCLMIKQCSENGKVIDIRLISLTLSSFFMAYAVYSGTLHFMDVTVSRNNFLPFEKTSLSVINQRLDSYISVYNRLLDGGYRIAGLPILIISFFSFILMSFNGVKKTNLIMIIVCFFGLYLLVMLPNLLLVTGWITARTFICFPLLVYAIIIVANAGSSKVHENIYVACLLFLFCFSFFVSSTFGSTLKANDDYSKYIAQNVTNDIMDVSSESSFNVVISGRRPDAINNIVTFNSFPFLRMLSPTYMTEGWSWGVRDLSRYARMNFLGDNAKYVKERCSWPVLKQRGLYHLLKKDNVYIVDFNYKACRQ